MRKHEPSGLTMYDPLGDYSPSIKGISEPWHELQVSPSGLWVPSGSYDLYLLHPVNPDHAQTTCVPVQLPEQPMPIAEYVMDFCFASLGIAMLCVAGMLITEVLDRWRE